MRFDLGTSLVTTEDLEMEFQEFKTRAQVTTTRQSHDSHVILA